METRREIDPLDRWALRSRRNRLILHGVLLAACVGYVVAWAIDRGAVTASSPVRSWFIVCLATVGAFVFAGRIHTEFSDPERAKQDAAERAVRRAENMADFSDWGVKVALVAGALFIAGFVLIVTVADTPGLVLMCAALVVMWVAPRRRPPWAGGRRRPY